MKKATVAVLIVVMLLFGLLLGCRGLVTGSGELETRQFDFSDFSRVEVGSAFDFEINRSDSYVVSITADDNLFEYIQVSRTGETLKIGLKPIASLGPVTLEAAVTMPRLRGLDISGASSGTVAGFSSAEGLDVEVSGASSLEMVRISAGDVEFNISGASKVKGDLQAGDAELEVSGASTAELEGSAGDIDIDASGASNVRMAGFPVNNADVSLSGASDGTINLSGRLDADISGASSLEYIGEPTLGKMNIAGASTLKKK